ncbi:hypothetical protein, partial [Persephonella sp.]
YLRVMADYLDSFGIVSSVWSVFVAWLIDHPESKTFREFVKGLSPEQLEEKLIEGRDKWFITSFDQIDDALKQLAEEYFVEPQEIDTFLTFDTQKMAYATLDRFKNLGNPLPKGEEDRKVLEEIVEEMKRVGPENFLNQLLEKVKEVNNNE